MPPSCPERDADDHDRVRFRVSRRLGADAEGRDEAEAGVAVDDEPPMVWNFRIPFTKAAVSRKCLM